MREIVAELTTHKIGHALCWSSLLAVTHDPTDMFQLLLKVHHTQRGVIGHGKYILTIYFHIGMQHILGVYLHNHSRVAPFAAAVRRRHSVDKQLACRRCRRHHHSTGTHTEAVDTASVDLCRETVLCCRKILAASIGRVVLYAVDEFRRVFKAHSNSKALCLKSYAPGMQGAVDILRRMTSSENNSRRKYLSFVGTYSAHPVVLDEQFLHACLETYLTATLYYAVADVLDDTRQFVGTYVGMSVGKYRGTRSMLAEDIQHAFYATTLLAACVELAVGICSSTALAEAVVRLGIHLVRTGYLRKVKFSCAHVTATLHNDGADTVLYELERSKETRRTGAHHNDRLPTLDIAILTAYILIHLRHLIDKDTHGKVHIYYALTGIDAATQHAHRRNGAFIHALLTGDITLERLLIGSLVRLHSYLKFVYHTIKRKTESENVKTDLHFTFQFQKNSSEYQAEGLFYLAHREHLNAEARCIKAFGIALGDNNLLESQLRSLGNTLLDTVHRAYLTREAHLACHTYCRFNLNIHIA